MRSRDIKQPISTTKNNRITYAAAAASLSPTATNHIALQTYWKSYASIVPISTTKNNRITYAAAAASLPPTATPSFAASGILIVWIKAAETDSRPEELVFESGLGDGEVDDGDLYADLRQVVRVGQLGCHVELERLVVFHVAVSKPN